jgi:hypothetical protein
MNAHILLSEEGFSTRMLELLMNGILISLIWKFNVSRIDEIKASMNNSMLNLILFIGLNMKYETKGSLVITMVLLT